MKKLKQLGKRTEKEENMLASISDLMSGLMIVFLFIAISFMSKINKESDNAVQTSVTVKNIIDTYNKNKTAIYDDLVIAFQDKSEEWNMKIDESDGTIRFEEPEVLFDHGKSTVKPKFKEILNEFFPTYIKTIYKSHKDCIKEIRIEGHTSSTWSKDTNELEAFFNNMELSQDRTREVLNYVMSIPQMKEYEEWLRKHMTANGMSSSQVIISENGIEDEDKSRRVEFKIITNAEDVIGEILDKGFQGDNE